MSKPLKEPVGHGKLGSFACETPTMLRFGQQSADEFFVSEAAAQKGVTIVNQSPVEPLALIKSFGHHPEAPASVPD